LSRGSRTSVILFRLRDARPGTVMSRLGHVLEESSAALVRGAIVIVEDARHRVRLLPVGSD
ncbi:hypothetical protein, partial [Flavihumibacter cheonanensis]|uniref:hypothetical protein n=1 Tax=Flavihumibacter cheonanensis TaxID=1442385 RepID=UPI001EF8845B